MRNIKKTFIAASAALCLTLSACQQIGKIEIENNSEPEATAPIVTTTPQPEPIVTPPPVVLDNTMPSVDETMTDEQKTLFEKASAIVNIMTVEQKVSQLFILELSGDVEYAPTETDRMIGGIFYSEKYLENASKSDVIALNEAYSQDGDMLICTFEQGGSVAPVSSNKSFRGYPFWGIADLYAEGGTDLVGSDSRERCILLNNLGINANICVNAAVLSKDDEMYSQTAKADGEDTASIVKEIIRNYDSYGVSTMVGNFPYGVETLDTLSADDGALAGYKSAVENGADFIVMYSGEIGGQKAYLNENTYAFLRNDLGYKNAAVCDMRTAAYEDIESALTAGADMMIISDMSAVDSLTSRVRQGEYPLTKVNEAVVRIVMSKLEGGIISVE